MPAVTKIKRTSARNKPRTKLVKTAKMMKAPAKSKSRATKSGPMKVSSSQGVENQSTYNKLIKRGMSPKQAAAFARHAGGQKKSGAKSSKGVTKRVTSRGKKK